MKKYLITSKEFCHEQVLKYLPEYVLYRDKTTLRYEEKANSFLKVIRDFKNTKCFLHQDVDLAKKLGADGVHLTSQQFDKIEYAKSLGLEVIVSTHLHIEVLDAQNKGADAVTYSPIFHSPNKGEPKGVEDLVDLLNKVDIKVFALGGIIDSLHVEILKPTGVYGFASIRYFD